MAASQAFHSRTGSLVTLSNGNRTAQRNHPTQEFNNGIVISKDPLRDNEIFEVIIDKKVNSWSGSIEIGVSTQDPAHLDFPTSATSLREGAWIMSGCSILRDGRSVMDEYGRDLDQLNQGDRVGVQRTLNGELHIYIKGVDQGCAAKGLPASVYAVVDMYGKCIQVSIVNHDRRLVLPVNGLEEDILARIPSTFQRSASNEVLRFHERCGSLIKLSNNNRTAERRRPLEEFNNGVVMTNRPLRDNELFEIRIDRLVDKWSGSIEMGITTHNPGLLDFPATMTNMRTENVAGTVLKYPNTHSSDQVLKGTIMMSGCGILTNGKGTRREYGEFNLDELTEGDYVGLVRKANGTLHYYINGLDQGVASSRTPQTVYGVVDLYGMTVKVTITDRDTLSPIYERLERRSFFGLNSGNSEYNEDANGEQNERILFHSNCGAHAMVINNGKTALRPHAMDDFNNGVILTNRPLRNNEVFEVRLDEIVDKWAGSIEIGVTTHSPREIEFPSTMTNIRSGTWMMTGNGIMHNGTTVIDEYGQNLDRLGVGDCVGVMRKENGTLHFYVNGIDQGTAAYNIPDVLYAVIDLYGQAAEASIIDSSDPVQQMDNNPNSVRSMRRTSNITLTQDEQTNDLRFHHLHGANAMITNNGLTACRPNATGEFNDAIVMSNRTLRTGELFEVVIEKMVDRWSGSIEAGVTAIHPTDLDFPSTMTDIDYNTWMLSGSAVMQDGTTVKNGYLLDLDTISVNSRIGMMRALDGSLHYFVDGVDMGVACTDIAENVYAVIDLYGQCSQATIVQSTIRDNHTLSNSSNALLIEHPIPSVSSGILHKFHQYCGKNISIRSSGCSAYRIRSFNHGIIFSSRPLKTGELFEVKVEQVSKRWSGSLQIGLTTFVPSEALPVNSLPPAASELRTNRNTWLMQGSEVLENGVSLKENYATTLDRLEIGNTVGVKRCSDDTMHVVINGEDKGIAASNIPKGSYAIIDLYGTTEGVTITSSAVEYPDSSRAPSIASDLSDEIEEINGHMESVQEPVCIEFQENHGKNIQLCNGNLTACRTASYNQGVVVSSKPLPIMQRFQIRIDRLNSRWTSSLQIGVLGFSPEKLNFPPTASTIKRCCWVVQSDSVFHNGVKVKEKFGPNLDTLQIGHKVGIMLDNDHSLHYYVNDVDQGMAAKNIPFGSFAVVDLYGQCEQVTIVADDSSMAASLPVEGREKQDMEDGLKESVCPTPPLTDNVIRNCEYQNRCIRFKSTIGLPDGYFESDPKMSICYCETCHKIRGDEPYYKKGQPPKDYALPFGWCKFALRVMPRAQLLNAFKEWHIAYHGTKVGHIRKVLDKGELVLPGGENMMIGGDSSDRSDIHDNRRNKNCDNTQIFLSPTIKYAGQESFAQPYVYKDPKSHSWQVARVVFQICVKPGSYKCGPPSVGANEPIDPQFSNNEIEWYSKEKGAIILQSLLVKID